MRFSGVVCLLFVSVAFGQEPDKTKTDRRHTVAWETVKNIDAMIINGDSREPLSVKPNALLSHQTTVRQWSKGSAWVWVNDGRPHALLSLSTWNSGRLRFYEFLSFSRQRLELKADPAPLWTPRPGWKPSAIPKTTAPARSKPLRLVQMRQIAKRFTAYQKDFFANPADGDRHEMRLLPQPIYRYESESNESLDGALFGFVRNGDLELVLVIEAEKASLNNPAARWVYAPYPVAVHELNLAFDDRPVWHLEHKSTDEVQNPEDSYFLYIRDATDEEISESD